MHKLVWLISNSVIKMSERESYYVFEHEDLVCFSLFFWWEKGDFKNTGFTSETRNTVLLKTKYSGYTTGTTSLMVISQFSSFFHF